MASEFDHASTPSPDSNEPHRTRDMVSKAADKSTDKETNVMKKSHENETTEAVNNANKLEPGTTPDINDIKSEENTNFRLQQLHDAFQYGLGEDWTEPFSFEESWELGHPHNPLHYPLSFLPITFLFSRAFNVSYEAVNAILMFLLSSAIGGNVRVKQASGEWDSLSLRFMLYSETQEKASSVLWAMARVFLERRVLLETALATGETTDGQVSEALEAKLSELYNRANQESWPLYDFLNAIAALPAVPSESTEPAGSAPQHISTGNDNGDDRACVGLEWGDPDGCIASDEDRLVLNLNGRPHSSASSPQSVDPKDSSRVFIMSITPPDMVQAITDGVDELLDLPYALADWAPGSEWDGDDRVPVGEPDLKHLRDLLMSAFHLQRLSAQEPIELVLCDHADADRAEFYQRLLGKSEKHEAGPQVSDYPAEIVRLATKLAALISLCRDEYHGGEIPERCWRSGLTVACTLYQNREDVLCAISESPATSKAELLLQSAAELGTTFTIGDIVQKQSAGIVEEDEAVIAVMLLYELGWVRPVAEAPQATDAQFEFHPLAFEQTASDSTPNASPPSDQPGAE